MLATPLVVAYLLAVASFWAAEAQEYLGPVALVASKDAKTLYVAHADARQIAWVDLAGAKVIRRIGVPAEPTGLALSPDATTLYATCTAPQSSVCVIDAASGELIARIPAGHTAMGPVVTPDGKRLYVCNRFSNDVSVIDLEAGKQTACVPVVREPVAAAVTPNGKSVLVANHLPMDRADSFYVTPVVTVIDTRTGQTTPIRLPNGANGLRGLCVSPDGKYAYVTHILSNYELVPSQVEQGWTNTNVISIIDTRKNKLVNTVGLDDMYLGAANPWGVACTADGETICVTHAGTHELSVIDAPAMLGTLLRIYISPLVGGIPSSPGIGAGVRRRTKLPGKGPRGLAVAGSKAYVAEYFTDTLAVVDLRPGAGGRVRTIPLGPRPQPTMRRRGEILFHDATICYQHWQSCASCHPDGRADGLNWDLMNDGVGNPKNTKSMLLAYKTPPAMSTGARVSAEAAVRSGIRHILFADRPQQEAEAIDAYLKSLRPEPSPHLAGGRLSPAALRGKRLFESEQVGCHKCHPAPLYADLEMYDVGTRNPYDINGRFDTPTLIEVWRTSPYLHDGRYTTIRELITKGRHGLKGGRLEELTARQIEDLVEFVLSL